MATGKPVSPHVREPWPTGTNREAGEPLQYPLGSGPQYESATKTMSPDISTKRVSNWNDLSR
jgi:hypothetical protein